ncbi:hypothetical protein RHDE110596_16740 [Prescottella defluvii]|uniref:hypothetical protein n=1 Tax=Prescottella defluvii TaxID=1323361 RepID=UPI0004F3D8B3|nr:hypothetical protein [Prescottella defluvii]
MAEQIPYDAMRRLLGLPGAPARTPAPWAVRRIHNCDGVGRWGVWERADSAPHYRMVESFPTWTAAMREVTHDRRDSPLR